MNLMFQLRTVTGMDTEKIFPLQSKLIRIDVGRNRALDVNIDHRHIARLHFILWWDEAHQSFIVEALSGHDLAVNGKALIGKPLLADGDILSISDLQMIFERTP